MIYTVDAASVQYSLYTHNAVYAWTLNWRMNPSPSEDAPSLTSSQMLPSCFAMHHHGMSAEAYRAQTPLPCKIHSGYV